MMLRKLLLGAATAVLLSTSAQAADKLTVLLDWFVNPDHAPLLVAEQIGAFAEQGLEVELVPPADPSLPPRLLAAKQADLAIGYQPQLYLLVEEGLPVVRVGTLVGQPLNTLMAIGGRGIEGIADLKGKSIGFSVAGVDDATLAPMLSTAGLTLADIKLVNVNFQLVSALLAKQVDAVIGGYRNVEALEVKEHDEAPVVFDVEKFGIPVYDELIVLARKDATGDPRIARFLAAVGKATAYLKAHPDDTWAAFAKTHKDLDTPLNKASWAATVPLFADDPGRLDTPRYAGYAAFLRKAGLIKSDKPVGEYAVEVAK